MCVISGVILSSIIIEYNLSCSHHQAVDGKYKEEIIYLYFTYSYRGADNSLTRPRKNLSTATKL